MTKRLEQAFEAVAKLSEKEQEAFAALINEELASEARWADAYARSQDQLAALADEALAEHRAGQTRPFEQDSDLSDD